MSKDPNEITVELDIDPIILKQLEAEEGSIELSPQLLFLKSIADPDCTDCGGSGTYWFAPPGSARQEQICECVRRRHAVLEKALRT
jgi:hypothetical protein